jgi:lysophospholipase L1-like esterase
MGMIEYSKLKKINSQLTEKANYFSNTKNVFNKTDQVSPNINENSYLKNDGTIGSLSSYYISTFIPIKPSTKYILTAQENGQSLYGGWYDGSKTWISSVSMIGGILTTSPNNASYIRLNIEKSVDIDTLYFHEINGYYKSFYNGKKVNFLGDSITEGFGTTKTYVDYLNDVIGFGVVRNYGVSGSNIAYISGESISSFEKRYKTMDNDADIVFVFGGINDYLHNSTVPIGTSSDRVSGTFYGALHVLLSGLIKKYLDKKIFYMTPLHTTNEDVANSVTSKTLIQYVDIIKEVCKYYGIKVIDLYSNCLFNPNINILMYMYAYDGIHPNERGHKNIAETILNEL